MNGGEYWIHNDNPITQGKDFTLEFTTGDVTHGTAAHGCFGATRSNNKDGWAYGNLIQNGNQFALWQNGTGNVALEDDTHYRFHYRYMADGNYEFKAYRTLPGKSEEAYYAGTKSYMAYMGLYIYGFNFEAPLTSIKCYEGSGEDVTDLGVYAEASKSKTLFEMEDGASIRLTDPTGLGFTSRISRSTYDEAVAAYGEANVSTGTLIAMTSDVSTLDSFTHANLSAQGVKYLDVKNEGFKNEDTAATDGYYTWRGSIVNMYEHNLTKDFSAVGYYCVNGEYTYTAYDAEENSRNVRYIANAAYNDTTATKTDKYSNQIVDGAHAKVGEYSPYTAQQLQVLNKYTISMDNISSWWSIESQQPASYGVTLASTGAMSYVADFKPVGDNAMPSNAFTTLTLNATTVNMLMSQGYTSVQLNFGSKANQGTYFALYPYGNNSVLLKNGNMSCSYTVELTEDAAKNGIDFTVVTSDIHASWNKSDATDGFTLSMNLNTAYDAEKPLTWFVYDGKSDGISYNAATESWQFDVANDKVLTLAPEAIAKYKAEGAAALQFTVSSKPGQSTSFDFRSGRVGNNSFSFTVEITDELCENGWSAQTYFRSIEGTSDGYLIKIATIGVYETPSQWFAYNGTTSGISYANNVWTITGVSAQTLTLHKDVVDNYLEQGIFAVKVAIGTKDGKAISSGIELPYSTDVIVRYSGAYKAENNSVTSNGGTSITIKLTEEMARDGLLLNMYYNDRGWAGDVAGADGFTITLTTELDTSLPENWVIGKDIDVTYDGTKYTLTAAGSNILNTGYNHIGISRWLIDKMVAEGYTKLSFLASASNSIAGTGVDFVVPDAASFTSYRDIEVNIADLSANGNASSYYSVDGYYTLRFYVSNNNTAMYMQFAATPKGTPPSTSFPENWVVGKDMNVAYDSETGKYTLTKTGSNILGTGYNYIGISRWLIDKMVAEGKTTLTFLASASNPISGKGVDFVVPDAATFTSYRDIVVNIADLSANGDASSYYSVDGYYTLQFYVSNNNTAMYIEFNEVPAEPYKIVYAARAENAEYEAAMMLAERLEEATGVRYEVVSDRHLTWSEDARYISIGQTNLLNDVGLGELAESSVTGDGYIRRTVGNTLFIDGITARGTLYGVIDYLEEAYEYVFIDGEVYTYTADTQLKINVGEKDFSPTFNTRTYLTYETYPNTTNGKYALYNKANCYYVRETSMVNYGGINKIGAVGQVDHNTWETLVKGVELYNAAYGTSYDATAFAREYTVNGGINYNPCLSGGLSVDGLTAWDFMTLAMKDCILSQYQDGVRYYSLTQEDSFGSGHYCECTLCMEQAALYGRSGLMVNFYNRMIEALDADKDMKAAKATDYRVITYAYHYTLEVPTGDVTCNDKLVIRLAYSADCAQKGVSANANNYIAQWSEIANELMYWGYSADFRAYIPYYPSLTSMADDVKFLKDHKVSFVMILGAYNANNIWHDEMRSYVYSKLLYNFDEAAYAADKDAYVQSLVSEYLNIYYGEYADEVQSVIDYYQEAYSTKVPASGKEYATCLTRSQHTSAYNLIKSSYENCTDAVMKKRLASVAASCYAGALLASDYGRGQYIATCKALCEAAGITQWSEMVTAETFLNS